MWLKSGKSAVQVAEELGMKQRMGGVPPAHTTPPTMEELEAENQRLHRELQNVIRQREI